MQAVKTKIGPVHESRQKNFLPSRIEFKLCLHFLLIPGTCLVEERPKDLHHSGESEKERERERDALCLYVFESLNLELLVFKSGERENIFVPSSTIRKPNYFAKESYNIIISVQSLPSLMVPPNASPIFFKVL